MVLFHVAQRERFKSFPSTVKIGSVRIELKKGDITNETVRGIVNSTNREMTLKGGVFYFGLFITRSKPYKQIAEHKTAVTVFNGHFDICSYATLKHK